MRFVKAESVQTIRPDEPYIHLLHDVPFRPIFIMGDHRSGTTLLYQLLARTQYFNVVTAYHVIRYDELLSNHINRTEGDAKQQLGVCFRQLGLADRMIDRVKVSPDLPEEYGFILRNSGYKTQLSAQTMPAFMELCQKVQCISNPDRPLLLKNPWDFLNFVYVKQVFPEAKFIFVHRNPINVINSQIKAIRSLLQSKNLYVAFIADWYNEMFEKPFQLYLARLLFSLQLGLGLRIVRRHVILAATYFLENVHQLPETDYMGIRYEDLCREPDTTITAILNFLQFPKNLGLEAQPFIQMRPTHLFDEVERNKTSILRRLAPYVAYCGYGVDDAVQA